MNPAVIAAVAGISTLFGLLAAIALFFLHQQLRPVERSIREVAEGEGLFNPEQVIKIIAEFKDEGRKLEALIRFTELDRVKAIALLSKVENNVNVGQLAQLSN